MRRHWGGWAVLVLMGVICEGCSRKPEAPPARPAPARAPAPAKAPPAVKAANVVEANTLFAIELYRTQREQPGNLFFSPYSLSLALAMASAGARGETQAQLTRVLHVPDPPEKLGAAFRALRPPAEVESANALWAQEGKRILEPFLTTLRGGYGAPLQTADFARAPEAARARVNGWASEHTHGRITQLVPRDGITDGTRLMLANAVYFKADWAQPFEPSMTETAPFTLLNGKAVRAPLMHHKAYTGYAEGQGWQAVELPYQGGRLSLVAILPPAKGFAAFEQGLTAERLQTITKALQGQEVSVFLPRFTLATTLPAKAALAALGVVDAFNLSADFSGVDGLRPASAGGLYLTDVFHQAYVKVDERGTEAAAATGVPGAPGAPAPPAPVIRLDHPFVFLIRDVKTGLVLFLGRVLDPRG